MVEAESRDTGETEQQPGTQFTKQRRHLGKQVAWWPPYSDTQQGLNADTVVVLPPVSLQSVHGAKRVQPDDQRGRHLCQVHGMKTARDLLGHAHLASRETAEGAPTSRDGQSCSKNVSLLGPRRYSAAY